MAKIDTEKFIEHLRAKWGNSRPCPVCGGTNWTVGDSSYELREYRGGDFLVGQVPIMPLVPVICTNCGNTILINSIVAQIPDAPAGVKK